MGDALTHQNEHMPQVADGAEHERIARTEDGSAGWRDWGPYVAERAWGTVREDYSADGDAWEFFPHDHARSRAFRWNEDGMAAFSDLKQTWCLGLSLWNGRDAILKERMFGLAGPQGNHGEDVKEYWWYLDGTPTHTWNTWRYHYPQAEYPYADLIATNAARSRLEPEYELVDTGVFDDDRYWVVTVDYAKDGPHDLLMRITIENAGPDPATLHVLPTLWFRNTWSWGYDVEKPSLRLDGERIVGAGPSGALALRGDGAPEALFCDNETNTARLFGASAEESPAYPKDGINDHIVDGAATVNPDRTGTKAALHYTVELGPGETRVIRVRLTGAEATPAALAAQELGPGFDAVVAQRAAEADAFYAALPNSPSDPDEARVLRQAFAGLLWSKQYFHFNVNKWLDGDPGSPPPPPGRGGVRNGQWRHFDADDVILMPDPWEYPWFAAWDLAFHCVTMAHIDPAFAKAQLILLLREWYMHPNGQLPAYEWNFSDVNPPTHAWAAIQVFLIDGGTDYDFLARILHKLLINYTWWTNSKDKDEDDLFEGGFMGLDNIAPLNRSTLPPEVGTLEQADSTGWMASYALDLLEIALRLARRNDVYEDVAEDAYFYDVLHLVDGREVPLKVRSLVGLVPVVASLAYDEPGVRTIPEFRQVLNRYLAKHPELGASFHRRRIGDEQVYLLAMVSPERLTRILKQVFDTAGLLSDHGIRGVSAYHREHPFTVEVDGVEASVDYEPAESTSLLFGGNSNWRGPVWFPLNALLIAALQHYESHGETGVRIEDPLGSGNALTPGEAADDLSRRLISLFLPGPDGRRPADARYPLLSADPRWKDNIFFYEYFDGDTGQGLGASHQTGWTAMVAHLILTRRR